jgi:hypothetical protein
MDSVPTLLKNVSLSFLSPPRLMLAQYSENSIMHSAQARGVRGSVVVKGVCYKPEGRGLEIR